MRFRNHLRQTMRERYARLRAGAPDWSALDVWRFAKQEAANYRFERAAQELHPTDSLGEYERDAFNAVMYEPAHGESLRIEVFTVPDEFGRNEQQETETLESYYDWARQSKKLGRTQAREFAARQMEELEAEKGRDLESCGIIARAYWRGELVADESCYGYEYFDIDDLASFGQEMVAQALWSGRKVIREKARNLRRLAREFGYIPPDARGYRPAA